MTSVAPTHGEWSHPVPASAAWRHTGSREGVEATFFEVAAETATVRGATVAIEGGEPWTVGYAITVDSSWRARRASVWSIAAAGERRIELEGDGDGAWRIDGERRPDLQGCLDVDLESSACTNTFPLHRLQLPARGRAEAPATYVRVPDLAVERLEQTYTRLQAPTDAELLYDYRAPRFDFECRLRVDASLLVLDYPGIATRFH
jgi:uncharacterized protein